MLVTGRQGFCPTLPLRFKSDWRLPQILRWSRLRDYRLSDTQLELYLRKFKGNIRWFNARLTHMVFHNSLINIELMLFRCRRSRESVSETCASRITGNLLRRQMERIKEIDYSVRKRCCYYQLSRGYRSSTTPLIDSYFLMIPVGHWIFAIKISRFRLEN